MKYLFVLLLTLVGAHSAGAQTCKDAECYDTNPKDGRLNLAELRVYFIHAQGMAVTKKTDANFDGSVDPIQVQAFVDDLQRRTGHAEPFTLAEVTAYSTRLPTPKSISSARLLLRESSEDVSPFSKAKPGSKAKPLLLSYARNLREGHAIWVARGAVMYRLVDQTAAWGNRFFLFPSVAFNRVITPDTDEQANSLVFRLGAHQLLVNPGSVIEVQVLRAYVNYATDFDFESRQVGAELEWEPLFRSGPFGNYYTLLPSSSADGLTPVQLRVQTFLRAETGYVLEAGDKSELAEDEDFLRVGGQVEANLLFFERLLLSGSQTYLKGVTGKPDHSRLTDVSASYFLGEQEQIGFKLEYQKGNVPLTQEKVENLVFGVAIKL